MKEEETSVSLLLLPWHRTSLPLFPCSSSVFSSLRQPLARSCLPTPAVGVLCYLSFFLSSFHSIFFLFFSFLTSTLSVTGRFNDDPPTRDLASATALYANLTVVTSFWIAQFTNAGTAPLTLRDGITTLWSLWNGRRLLTTAAHNILTWCINFVHL